MTYWHLWTSFLTDSVFFIASHVGVSEAIAIVLLTAIIRSALMPLSLTVQWRLELNRQKLRRLQSELAALRSRLVHDKRALGAATMALYRANGVRLVDRWLLANLGSQVGVGLGMYQAIGQSALSSGFLWIASLAKPDAWITALVAALMLLGMAIAPGAFADSSAVVMFVVASVIAVVAVAAMPSAFGVYWATSNVATLVQNVLLRVLLARRRHGVA